MHKYLVSCFTLACLVVLGSSAFAQQTYVGRFDAYAGFMYLDSPKIGLAEPGFHIQVGYRPKVWYSLGFDFSDGTGSTTLTPSLLTTALQQQLGAQLTQLAAAGRIPAGYALKLPVDSSTQTFAAGPQVSYHHWKYVTPFIRPALGAIHETATPKPGDPIAAGVVQQLAPSGKKTDWVAFYGVGGGFDINPTKHLSLRVQADFVRDHLFDDLLRDSRNTVRFSIGPAFQWGKNLAR